MILITYVLKIPNNQMIISKNPQPAVSGLCAFTHLEESMVFQQTLHTVDKALEKGSHKLFLLMASIDYLCFIRR